jgi:hypothetical protein
MQSRRRLVSFATSLFALAAGFDFACDATPDGPPERSSGAGQGGTSSGDASSTAGTGAGGSGGMTGAAGKTGTGGASGTVATGGGSGPAGTGGAGAAGGGGIRDAGGGGSARPDAGASPEAGVNGGGFAGDIFVPWAGGPGYYAKWPHGFPTDAAFFPIAVWLQSPVNAKRYAAVGVNVFIGLWDGPLQASLDLLRTASVFTVCDQSADWKANVGGATIRGWLQPDEPDNAQALSGGGYGPCIAPSAIVAGYDKMVAADGTRPVLLGLGRGVAEINWVGRGSCTGKTDMYPEYAKGADVLAFDIYPVNEGVPLEMVAAGVDNLIGWSNHAKPVIADIEASNFNNTTRPTPAQIKAEVWMALVHGAAGTQYFCHRFQPTFSETDCLDDAPTAAALPVINAQITSLAQVLNTQSVANGVVVTSSVPVDTMLKRFGGATYLFAVEMRAGTTTASFKLRDFPPTASAEVLGEGRTIAVTGGSFQDAFSSYGVHLYRIAY